MRTLFRCSGALCALFGLALFSVSPSPLTAGLVEVQNDSVVDFGLVTIQAGFVAGERGAAWLTPGCDGEIVAVRVLWLDAVGSGSQALGQAITISEAGVFPTPGAMLAELVGPVMTEGFLNEFTIVPPIPFGSGDTFVVDFEFFSDPPPTGPSLVTDIDGCQVPKNSIFAIPPSSWLDLCALGVSGDLAIRALVTCDNLIFEDDFESGDTGGWSSTVPLVPAAPAASYPILYVDPELPPFWQHAEPRQR